MGPSAQNGHREVKLRWSEASTDGKVRKPEHGVSTHHAHCLEDNPLHVLPGLEKATDQQGASGAGEDVQVWRATKRWGGQVLCAPLS